MKQNPASSNVDILPDDPKSKPDNDKFGEQTSVRK